jgi:hypothetical protein
MLKFLSLETAPDSLSLCTVCPPPHTPPHPLLLLTTPCPPAVFPPPEHTLEQFLTTESWAWASVINPYSLGCPFNKKSKPNMKSVQSPRLVVRLSIDVVSSGYVCYLVSALDHQGWQQPERQEHPSYGHQKIRDPWYLKLRRIKR